MNRYDANEKIQEAFSKGQISAKQDNGTYSVNMAIQNDFYDENEVEDDIDTSLSMNGNIGAVLLPEDKVKKK